jgi:hypothetical protein
MRRDRRHGTCRESLSSYPSPSERLGSPSLKPRARGGWITEGPEGIVDVARESAPKILKEHRPTRLDEGMGKVTRPDLFEI